MADGSAAGSAGEASVCDQSDSGVKSHTGDRGSGVEHLTHAGTALGSFVADHDNVSFIDLAAGDGSDGILFAVKDAGRTFMDHHLGKDSAALDDAGIGSQVALEDGDAAVGHVGVLDGADDLGIKVYAALDVLPHGLAGHGDQVEIQKTLLV